MYEEPSKKYPSYLSYGGFIPSNKTRIPDIFIGNSLDNKNYYQNSTSNQYLTNKFDNSNSIDKNNLNNSLYKIDYIYNTNTNDDSLDKMIINKHKQRSVTNNICFIKNVSNNDFKISNLSTMKNSFQTIPKIENCKGEIPILFKDKDRKKKIFTSDSEYNKVNNKFPLEKNLVSSENGIINILNEKEKQDIINNIRYNKRYDNIITESNDEKVEKKALRYEYDNNDLHNGTKKSCNLYSNCTVHIPSAKINNPEKKYLHPDPLENSKSKFNDYFFSNNKTLKIENIKIRIPGFSGHVPRESEILKLKERRFCLSVDKGDN